MLRLRDDCIPFDPSEMAQLVSEDTSGKNIGIRMVYGIADEITYQNLLGLNVLTMHIKEHELAEKKNTAQAG